MQMQTILRTAGLALMLSIAGSLSAQPTARPAPMGQEYSEPMPIEPQPAPAAAPAPAPAPAPAAAPVAPPRQSAPPVAPPRQSAPASVARSSPSRRGVPPVLPANPRNRAIEAAANGGAGGVSYAGPSGAMSTSTQGAFCTVTCPDTREYPVSCPPGYSALCQCDSEPYSSCRQQ